MRGRLVLSPATLACPSSDRNAVALPALTTKKNSRRCPPVCSTRFRDVVVGIDEDVVHREAVELEGEMHHLEISSTAQGVPETKSEVRALRRDDAAGTKREEAAPAFALFDQAEREARCIGGEELVHKPRIGGESVQRADAIHCITEVNRMGEIFTALLPVDSIGQPNLQVVNVKRQRP